MNFDDPASLEVDLFAEHLSVLRSGKAIEAPVYDFASHTRSAETHPVQPAPIVVSEGIHLLGLPSVRALCDVCVFIDVDAELRLQRRIRRDTNERGRTEESVRSQWAATVAPMHDLHVEPSQAFADVIVRSDDDLEHVAQQLAAQLRA